MSNSVSFFGGWTVAGMSRSPKTLMYCPWVPIFLKLNSVVSCRHDLSVLYIGYFLSKRVNAFMGSRKAYKIIFGELCQFNYHGFECCIYRHEDVNKISVFVSHR